MTTCLNALIVDDEPLARRGLRVRLQAFSRIKLLEDAANVRSALEIIHHSKPDVLFLDIHMPKYNGFDLLEVLPENYSPMVVFVTAHDQFAIDAFDVNALGYLLKPVDEEKLAKTVVKLLDIYDKEQMLSKGQYGLNQDGEKNGLNKQDVHIDKSKLKVKAEGVTNLIDSASVIYIEAQGDYINIVTSEKTFLTKSSLKAFFAKLDPAKFFRIHRSIVMNTTYLKSVESLNNGEFVISMINGAQFRSGRSFRDVVRSLI